MLCEVIRMDKTNRSNGLIFVLLLSVVASCLGGCSAKPWYEGSKISAEHNCYKAPPSQREECLKNLNNKTYQEYKSEY